MKRKRTRAEQLWAFQLYLDLLKILDPERRDRLTLLFLNGELSKSVVVEFEIWMRTNRLAERKTVLPTRGSRLAFFAAWLNRYRPAAGVDERERLTRLYYRHQLDKKIAVQFHRYLRAEVLQPWHV